MNYPFIFVVIDFIDGEEAIVIKILSDETFWCFEILCEIIVKEIKENRVLW